MHNQHLISSIHFWLSRKSSTLNSIVPCTTIVFDRMISSRNRLVYSMRFFPLSLSLARDFHKITNEETNTLIFFLLQNEKQMKAFIMTSISFPLQKFSSIGCESNAETKKKKTKIITFIISCERRAGVRVINCAQRVIKANSYVIAVAFFAYGSCLYLLNRILFTHQFRWTNLKWLFISHENQSKKER